MTRTTRTRLSALLRAALPPGWAVGEWRRGSLRCDGPNGVSLFVEDTRNKNGAWRGWELRIDGGALDEMGGDYGPRRGWPEEIAAEALAAVGRIGRREVCPKCVGHGIEHADYSCRHCGGNGVILRAAS